MASATVSAAGSATEPAKRVRGKRPPDGEPVVDRALALLAAFDAGKGKLSLHELSRRSGIPVSSTLRLAGRLLAWGALERDEEGRYSIGLRLLEVASLAPRGHGLRQVALPFMSDLAAVTQQHVQLAVRERLAVTLVERFSSHSSVPARYRGGRQDAAALHRDGARAAGLRAGRGPGGGARAPAARRA